MAMPLKLETIILTASIMLGGASVTAVAQTSGSADENTSIGSAPPEDLLQAWDIDISPAGTNLPEGSGSVAQGEEVFANTCAACHGMNGEGGEGGEGMIGGSLVGGQGTLDSGKPVKTVGSYWPYATTLYDYIHRAMPFNAPQSLSPDEVYAVSAYVLNLNGIVPDNAVMDRKSLPNVEMPNRNGFDQMDTVTLAKPSDCMTDCTPLELPK